MSILTGIVLYGLIWWVMIFTTLSWGLKPGTINVRGEVAASPNNMQLRKKLIINSLISAVIWGVIYAIITYTDFSFRDWIQGAP